MTVTLLYFAWVRDKIGIPEESVDLPASAATVADVIGWLQSRGAGYAAAFENPGIIRAAINRTHVKHSTSTAGAREIAFFPPVTGG